MQIERWEKAQARRRESGGHNFVANGIEKRADLKRSRGGELLI